MCNSSPTKLGTVIVPPTSFNPSGKAGSQLASSCGGIQRHQNLPKEENKQSERGGKQSLPTTQEPLALAVLAPSASGCSASNTWTITPLRGFAVLLQSPQTDWYPFHSSACCLWWLHITSILGPCDSQVNQIGMQILSQENHRLAFLTSLAPF